MDIENTNVAERTYAIFLGTDGADQIKTIQIDPEEKMLHFLRKNIGCDIVEVVRARMLKKPYIMIVDEEGLMKLDTKVNALASVLYGALEHGNPIVGNAVILREEVTEDGGEFQLMTGKEAKEWVPRLSQLAWSAVKDTYNKDNDDEDE